MPYMVKIAPGVENIVIFAIRAAVSEIQLFCTFRGKLSLIKLIGPTNNTNLEF